MLDPSTWNNVEASDIRTYKGLSYKCSKHNLSPRKATTPTRAISRGFPVGATPGKKLQWKGQCHIIPEHIRKNLLVNFLEK
jgi:hypothetical protein